MAISSHLKKMRRWSRHCPENFRHKLLLMEAECIRFGLAKGTALPLYEQSIDEARQYEFLQNEALANELAGRFCLKNGDQARGTSFVQSARECYRRWGATGKVRALEEAYSFLSEQTGDPKSPSLLFDQASGTVLSLDTASIMRASQALAGSRDLDTLLKNLLRIVIQYAGAQRGVVIMEQSGSLRVVAEGSADSRGIAVSYGTTSETRGSYPVTLVNLAVRSGEVVIVNDIEAFEDLGDDPYLVEFRPLSLMCIPLIHFSRRKSAIYLENRLLASVFTAERIAVLNLLSHHIAISLENALLNREKEDILQYLHDSISSDMVNIRFISEMLNPLAGKGELAEKLAAISDIARNGVETLRTFMALAGRESLTLQEVVSQLADCSSRIFAQSDTTFELEEEILCDTTIPPFAAFHLQLICKEAMTNVRRHAAADRFLLQVRADEAGVVFVLEDDGRGFDSSAVGGKGHGLANMRSRAEKLGAGFSLTTEPGWGTQIRFVLNRP